MVISNVVAHKKPKPGGGESDCLDEDHYDPDLARQPLAATVSKTVANRLYGKQYRGDMLALLIRFPASKREQAVSARNMVTLPLSSVMGIPMNMLNVHNADFDGDTMSADAVRGCDAIVAAEELLTAKNVPHTGFDFVEHPIAEIVCYYHMTQNRNLKADMLNAYCKCLLYEAPYKVYSEAFRELEYNIVQQLSKINSRDDSLCVNVVDLIPDIAAEVGHNRSEGVVQHMINSKCSRLGEALIYQMNHGMGNLAVDACCSENLGYVNDPSFDAFTTPPYYNTRQDAKFVNIKSNMIGGLNLTDLLLSAQLARSSIVATKTEITKPGCSPGRLMLNMCNVVISEIYSCCVKDTNCLVVPNATKLCIWVKLPPNVLDMVRDFDEDNDVDVLSKEFRESLFVF